MFAICVFILMLWSNICPKMLPFRDNRKKLIFNILKEFGQIGRQIGFFATNPHFLQCLLKGALQKIVLWIWLCRGSNYFIRHQFHAKIIELEHSHFGNWEKCDFSRKSGKSTNFTLKIDFSVILNHMDLKIWTLFIRTLFYDRKKFQFNRYWKFFKLQPFKVVRYGISVFQIA